MMKTFSTAKNTTKSERSAGHRPGASLSAFFAFFAVNPPKSYILAALLLSACTTSAQVRSVSTDTNGLIVAPANFWASNSAALSGAIGSGRGIIKSGGQIHVGQSAAYTTGLMPYASGASSLGFASTVFYDEATGRLTLGPSPIAGLSTLHLIADGTSSSGLTLGTGGVRYQLYTDSSGNAVLQFGSSASASTSFTLQGLNSGGTFTAAKYRSSGVFDINGNIRFLVVGPGKMLATDSSNTNLIGVTMGSGVAYDPVTATLTATGSGGSVTSVGLSVPSFLTVTGSPVTGSGTLAVTTASGQTANFVLATPDGTTGAASLRALVAADIPSLAASKITSGTIDTARLGSGTANSTTFARGDQTWAQVADAQVASGAAIGWSKLSKTGSSLADLDTRSASDLSSGTLSTNRLQALVKDLGAITGVTGDLFWYDGTNFTRLPKGPEGFALIISNGVPVWSTNLGAFFITNLFTTTINVTTQNVSVLNVNNTIKVNGKAATVFSANGTEMPIANLQDSSTAILGVSASTNLTVQPTNLANAQISASAAIAKSKISTSGTWAAADLPTIQSTADGGSSTVKLKNYIVLAFPHTCDGAGAIIATNDNSAKYFGQAAFAGGGAATTNFVEYRLTVPEDIDTAVALKVERFKFRLGAADTNAQSYALTMASTADSASFDSPTLGNSVTLSFAGDASGASGDVQTISSVTLTNWAGALTAGQFWVIRLARDGTDASTQTSYSGPLVISYGSTQ